MMIGEWVAIKNCDPCSQKSCKMARDSSWRCGDNATAGTSTRKGHTDRVDFFDKSSRQARVVLRLEG